LARAAYSSAKCIILDDPLSAVDAPTARHLVEQCICGPLMSERTRILVTHSVALCSTKADFALIMNKGCILDFGGKDFINRVLKKDKTLERLSASSSKENLDLDTLPSSDSTSISMGSLTIEEAKSSGAVSANVYLTYCYAAGGILFIFFLVFMFTLTQTLIVGNDLWLKTWASSAVKVLTQDSSIFQNGKFSTIFYLSIYGLISLSTILVIFGRIILVATGSLRASTYLHSSLLRRILGAPIRFFETTPTGRIMNRFSKDMKDIDQEVATFSADFVANLVSAMATVLLISIITPWTLLGLLPITIAYYSIARKYLCTSRELKRLEAITRSPIFSHFGEALQGASTIRSYGAKNRFIEENHKKVDYNHRAFFFMWISNRWLALRIDIIGAAVTLFSATSIILLTRNNNITAGNAGITLSYALALSDALLWLVRMHAIMEMEMNSVERFREYMTIEQEFDSVVETCRPTQHVNIDLIYL
jgi:ABC-type multidrug transport system fused ATPase/permease subunit